MEHAPMERSYVVTGGGQGVGRAIVERLARDGGHVVLIDTNSAATRWLNTHESHPQLKAVIGDASDEQVASEAADQAQAMGELTGWVNNAAVFCDAALDTVSANEVVDLISLNLAPVVAGCATAVRRFLDAGTGGAIVNVSSHQAQRAVRGALPYATAKAGIEGLTRAVAVDYGRSGIRANAVALGSIDTERYQHHLAQLSHDAAADTQQQMSELHPLGRVGRTAEVAATVSHLLSDETSFITGTVIPVDGGRAARGPDPEQVAH